MVDRRSQSSAFEARTIGSTSLALPVFGFGAAHLGELYGLVDEADSQAVLNAAWALGVRYFDTAPWYGRGLSEHRLGGFLRTKPRADFFVTTKVGRTLHRPDDPENFDRGPWTGGLNFEVKFDYGYDGIMRAYEQTLQRLALDRVDALIIHDLDEAYHGEAQMGFEEQLISSGMKALEELKKTGDIQAVGMGINTNKALETTATRVDLDFCLVAMPYTLLDQASLHTGMAEMEKRGVSVVIGAPFASGILVTGSKGAQNYGYAKAPEAVQARVKGIEETCAEFGVGLPAAALQFVLAHPIVASVIPGAAKESEIKENIASMQSVIPDAFWACLKERNLIDPASPVPAAQTHGA